MARFLTTFHEIISGRRKGFWPALVRGLLWPVSGIYREGIALRNRLYDRKLRRIHCLDCKVISVGNLTVGGTGKTPLVEYLARYFHDLGRNVCVVSRGYKSRSGKPSDEELLLRENLPEVSHIAGKDRVAAGQKAVADHQAQVVLMDDGFQHRRLARDLDIVTVDAINPFGFGHLLPRGLLREPPRSLVRAHVVVITRAGLVSPEELDTLDGEIARLAPEALIVHAEERVLALANLKGNTRDPDTLKGTRAVAFCGIGNPEGFRRTLDGLGVDTAALLTFGDHHHYASRDLEAIDSAAAAENAASILTTQKDRVKLPEDFPWKHEVLVVKIGMQIVKNEEELKRRLDKVTEEEPSN